MPLRMAVVGESMATGPPSMRIVPEVGRRSPKIVSATSVRFEPTSPAMPTISPFRTSNDTLEKVPFSDRFFTASAT
jgi:hypothetical protein